VLARIWRGWPKYSDRRVVIRRRACISDVGTGQEAQLRRSQPSPTSNHLSRVARSWLVRLSERAALRNQLPAN